MWGMELGAGETHGTSPKVGWPSGSTSSKPTSSPLGASHARADWIAQSPLAAADAIAYTQNICSTGAMPTPQSSAANPMDSPGSPTCQAFTPTHHHKPGNKN